MIGYHDGEVVDLKFLNKLRNNDKTPVKCVVCDWSGSLGQAKHEWHHIGTFNSATDYCPICSGALENG